MSASTAVTEEHIKVLVADDNQTDRMILSAILRKQGHEVVTASNGVEAVASFQEEKPELILLDALMPELDGFGAARQIKALAGEELVPIIFLTSLQDAASLANCLDAGGDDFLSKPYNKTILQAKIHAFTRMRNMHITLQNQRNQIAKHNNQLIHDQKVAKDVFDNVAHSGCLNADNIRHMISPLAVFNGDVLLATFKPSGGMHILLGDFTGHGLAAAIGAMPMAEVFYGMSSKGYAINDILREVNLKLRTTLPPGVFCCACMIDFSFRKRTMEVWMGGLPDCLLLRAKTRKIEAIRSKHLPLAVLSSKKFDDTTQVYEMELGDRFFIWSDGIHEARNDADQMYGEERLNGLFAANSRPEDLFEEIKEDVTGYIGTRERDDDITMLEVTMIEEESLGGKNVGFETGIILGPMDWNLTYELGPSTLRAFNPLPLMLQLLMEVPGLRRHSGTLYTVLNELYSNALEHGVIGLDSSLKADSMGFAEYYRRRREELQHLEDGYVKFDFQHQPTDDGGILKLRIEDSGQGFKHESYGGSEAVEGIYHGRGISLIQSLCTSLHYCGKGNQAEVVFEWTHEL
jgi:DNA-binding response OmpR family regulator